MAEVGARVGSAAGHRSGRAAGDRGMHGLEDGRVGPRVGQGERQRGAAPDDVGQVLDLEPVRVDEGEGLGGGLDAVRVDLVIALVKDELGEGLPPEAGPGQQQPPIAPHHLHLGKRGWESRS